MKIDEKILGKVRKVMQIDEESCKKTEFNLGGNEESFEKTGENLGKREERFEKRGKLYKTFMKFEESEENQMKNQEIREAKRKGGKFEGT